MPHPFIPRPGSTAILVLATIAALALAPKRSAADTTVEVRVSADNDDAEERSSNGWMYLDSSDLELAQDSTSTDTVGMRFTGLGVPQGRTITNAYIQFQADERDSGSVSLTIRGQDIDDAPTFTSASGNITSRTATSASVAWSPLAWNTRGQAGLDQRTPDISSIIQEIVDRSGWSSGNDLVIVITGTGTRTAESYDGDSSGAPLLHIEYEGDPPPGAAYYVRPDGNDANTGEGPTAGEAWRTVSSAFRKDILQAGDTVYVMAGTYVERIRPDEDGASGNPIRVIADTTGSVTGWPAGDVILQSNGEKVLEFDHDDYWYVHGFKISGVNWKEGIKVKDSSGVELSNCEIYGAKEGIRVDDAEATIINCIVRDSTEEGIYVRDTSTVAIWNCTVAHNAHDGIEVDNGTVTITNSVLAYNNDDGLDRDGGSVTHRYNLSYGNGSRNFEGTSSHATELQSNPQFADASGRDYHLQSSSPAVNAGTDAAGTVDDDLDGISRPIGSAWEMGCYEFPLIGHWTCNEGSGTDVLDSSGNGNHGTLQGGADWTGARCGYAVEMDGSGDWIDLGTVDIGTIAYTVGAWFKTAGSSRQTIFAATKTGTSDHLMLLEVGTDGRIRYLHRFPTGASGGTEVFSTDTFDDGKWHQVTAVKNATTITLYVDGLQVAQAADTTGVESSVDIVAGTSAKSGGSNDFNGSLDEILVYGSALSPTEVSNLYGMVGYWKLDETSGSTAADSTGFANHGTLGGSPVWKSEDGKVDGALEFDGSSDYVSVANVGSLQLTSTLTIAAWIKGDQWSSGSNVDVIARKGEGNPNNYQLAVADGTLALFLDDYDGDGFRGDTPLNTGQWYHVVGTWDGSTVRLYVDGQLDNDPPDTRTGSIGTDTRALYIGGRSGTDYFDGLIDDVRIYCRALCSDEIAELCSESSLGGWRISKWVEIDKPGS